MLHSTKRLVGSAAILAAVTLGMASTATAQVPRFLTQQGRLTDDSGAPVSGRVSISFALYEEATGGSSVWSETQTLTLDEGYFSTRLGASEQLDPGLFDGAPLYLGVIVEDDDEMLPRQRINSVPYAFLANNVAGDITPSSVSIGDNLVINSAGEWVGPDVCTPCQDGTSCTVAEGSGSSTIISCEDGTSATVSDGQNGQDGTPGTPGESCTVADNGDGTSTISCEGGTSATVSDGQDGTPGGSCTVADNGDGSSTISCEDGSDATVYDGASLVDVCEWEYSDDEPMPTTAGSTLVITDARCADGTRPFSGYCGSNGEDVYSHYNGLGYIDGVPAGWLCEFKRLAAGAATEWARAAVLCCAEDTN